MGKILLIRGTPGTGKSTLAKYLAPKLKLKILDLKPLLKKTAEGYDQKKNCLIINTKKLSKEILKIIKKEKQTLIISTHLDLPLPKKYIKICLITCCSDLKKLKKRLEKRKYSPEKIKENLESEIFSVCLEEAKEKNYPLLLIDTAQKINYKKLIKDFKKLKILKRNLKEDTLTSKNKTTKKEQKTNKKQKN